MLEINRVLDCIGFICGCWWFFSYSFGMYFIYVVCGLLMFWKRGFFFLVFDLVLVLTELDEVCEFVIDVRYVYGKIGKYVIFFNRFLVFCDSNE